MRGEPGVARYARKLAPVNANVGSQKMRHYHYLSVLAAFLALPQVVASETHVGGFITTDTVWRVDLSPFVVDESVLITAGSVLKVEAGVTVRVNSMRAISVADGTLVAIGTPSNPITFTAVQTNAPWAYIGFGPSSRDATFDSTGTYASGCVLSHCTVEYAGGAAMRGAITIDQSAPFVTDCMIRHNNHGGIFASMSNGLTIEQCTIYSNRASQIDAMTSHVGAGIYLWNSPNCRINACRVWGNACEDYAGGIALSDCHRGTLSNCRITDNRGGGGCAGGVGIFSSNDVTLLDCVVSNNVAGNGAGLYAHNSPNIEVVGCQFVDNDAGTGTGGGLFIDYRTVRLSMRDCTIRGNRATTGGGGIYFASDADMAVLSADAAIPTTIADNGGTNEVYNNNRFSFSSDPDGSGNIDARNTFWGTSSDGVPPRIFDFFDDASKGIVFYAPVLMPNEPSPVSIVRCQATGSAMTVVCTNTEPDSLYTLQWTSNLLTRVWSNSEPLAATNIIHAFDHAIDSLDTRMFYRINSLPWKRCQ